MRNFIQPGKVLTMTAPSGGVVSGGLYKFGSIVGIAATSAAEGEQFELSTGEVFELPKVSAQAWTVGQVIYADPASANIATTVSTDNFKIGVAIAIAANPSGSGLVRLNSDF